VIIEWKPKKEKDAEKNEYEGGFLHMHFWITKRMIINLDIEEGKTK